MSDDREVLRQWSRELNRYTKDVNKALNEIGEHLAELYQRIERLECEHHWTSVEQRQDDGTWLILEFCAWCGKGRNDG